MRIIRETRDGGRSRTCPRRPPHPPARWSRPEIPDLAAGVLLLFVLLAYARPASAADKVDVITFKNGEYAWGRNAGVHGKIARIDPAKTPREIDYSLIASPSQITRAIYKLDGDTYFDCYGPAGSARPKEFSSTAENGYTVMVLKRVKQAE